MFCEYCGNKLQEGVKFCTGCGKPVATAPKAVEPTPSANSAKKSAQSPVKQSQPKADKPKKSKGPVIALSIILAVLVIAVVVLGIIFFGMARGKDSGREGDRVEKSFHDKKPKDGTEIIGETEAESVWSTETMAMEATEADPFASETETSDSDDVFKNKNAGYIFPDSDTRKLTEEEIEDMLDRSKDPLWDIRIAINELYARHGRIFDTPEIKEYFEKQEWYEGTIEGKEFDEHQNEYLSDIEIYNRDLLSIYRAELQ